MPSTLSPRRAFLLRSSVQAIVIGVIGCHWSSMPAAAASETRAALFDPIAELDRLLPGHRIARQSTSDSSTRVCFLGKNARGDRSSSWNDTPPGIEFCDREGCSFIPVPETDLLIAFEYDQQCLPLRSIETLRIDTNADGTRYLCVNDCR
ncbi:hypothetical protein [Antarcticirhabdus aurantiaca]|uniref:Uncharacterized protein n=1 Tax=Antarcticirhabdus aurantiaca TaxID=2606717 RepID=A0ACD4NTK3_9HYPH|nr:hypothetical protein [Antarcticirhabdus aurantiaca]WAJ30150.1 hypothetical protein OXU80_08060 [Jeongeuplla avenae]